MEKTVINIKMDKKLKRDAQKVAKDLGLPLGTIVNHYLRDLVRDKRIVFQAPLVPNAKTRKILDEIGRDRKAGKNFDGPFTVSESIEYLKSL